MNDADVAVRDYLQWVEDPAQLVDTDGLRRLEKEIENAPDPLSRLKAIAAHERLSHPDESTYRSAFIQYAKDWAATNDVPATAFERLGVSTDVLLEAGIVVASNHRRAIRSKDDVKQAAARAPGRFSQNDIVREVGASPITVRKALRELLESKVIVAVGQDPNWHSSGRSPVLYERTAAVATSRTPARRR